MTLRDYAKKILLEKIARITADKRKGISPVAISKKESFLLRLLK